VETKLNRVLAYMDGGDWRAAISLAAKFGQLGRHKEAILRAQSAINNPGFYTQIGHDLDAIMARGREAMRARFGGMRDRAQARAARQAQAKAQAHGAR
jgi:hypothetical protein